MCASPNLISSSLRKSPKGQQQDCLERLLSLRRNLVEWWSTLPEVTNCRDLNPSGPLFRSNVHLKLDYCLTRIFIGRPFLFSNIRGINPAAVSTPTPPFKLTAGTSKNRTILVTDCVDAALEIVDLCRLLRDETGLARASFTEFSSCRAALLVILAQSLTKRTERLRESIDKGMALIKIMSMGVGSARSAVSVIEALERAIRRLEEWSVARGGNGSNPGVVESAYDRFKNWEMLWKSGPLSPSVSVPVPNGQDHIASGSGSVGINTGTPMPVTPLTTAGTAATSTTNVTNPDAMLITPTNQTSTHTHGSEHGTLPGQSAFSPANPHFAFDHFVSNFPQELDEFTAIPCFEVDAQQQVQAQNQASGQTRTRNSGQDQAQGQALGLSEASDNRWMEFINGD